MCYLPDENEAKKRAEEGHRKVEAALAALPEVRAAPALELLARLKKIESEIEAIWDAMPRVVELSVLPFVEENLERLSALFEDGVKTQEKLEDFLKELTPHPVDRVQIDKDYRRLIIEYDVLFDQQFEYALKNQDPPPELAEALRRNRAAYKEARHLYLDTHTDEETRKEVEETDRITERHEQKRLEILKLRRQRPDR
jgi:hypothetical protein